MATDFTQTALLSPLSITGGGPQFRLKNGCDVLGRIDFIEGSEQVRVSIQDGPETYRRFTIEAGKLFAFLEGESSKRELVLPADPAKLGARGGTA